MLYISMFIFIITFTDRAYNSYMCKLHNACCRCEIPVISKSALLAAVVLITQGMLILLYFVNDLFTGWGTETADFQR
jgi:hypothetical protein